MNRILILTLISISFGANASNINPFKPYERPIIVKDDPKIDPVEAGMSTSTGINGEKLSGDLEFIMELNGKTVYLDKKSGTYKTISDNNNDK